MDGRRPRRRTSKNGKSTDAGANILQNKSVESSVLTDGLDQHQCTFFILPQELLHEILGLILMLDVLSLFSTCKKMRCMVQQDFYFWRALTLEQFRYLCIKGSKNDAITKDIIDPLNCTWFDVFLAFRRLDRTSNIFMKLNHEVRRLQHLACKKMKELTEHIDFELKFEIKKEVQTFLIDGTDAEVRSSCKQCYFVHPLFEICPFCTSKSLGQSCEHSTETCRQICRLCGFLSEFMSCTLCQNVSLVKQPIFYCVDCNRTTCQDCQVSCEKCQTIICGYCNTFRICCNCRVTCTFCGKLVDNPVCCGYCGAKACQNCFDNAQLSEICEVCQSDFCEDCYQRHLPCLV